MTDALNASEIFEIAQQIERNGAMFYRKAADLFSESDICTMFIELADWEIKHEQVFRDMGKEFVKLNTKAKTLEPDNDPKLLACLAVFGTLSDPLHKLKSIENISDVLKTAITKEQDSISFYEGLRDFVLTSDDKNKVDDIIKEEMHHIKILNQALMQR
jgi:rubrerythrin